MTKPELIFELRRIGDEMINLGGNMEYFAGFDAEIAEHGREMLSAGMIARSWADAIEADCKAE